MSLILDALNKADNERKQNQEETPGIGTLHGGLLAPGSQGSANRRWILIGICSFAFLLVCVYLLGKSSGGMVSEVNPSSEKPQVSQAQTQNAAAATQTTSSQIKKGAVSSTVRAGVATPKSAIQDQTNTQKLIEAQYKAAKSTQLDHTERTQAQTSTANAAKSSIQDTKINTEINTEITQVAPQQNNTIDKLYTSPTHAPAKHTVETKNTTKEPKDEPVDEPVDPESLANFGNIGYLRELSYSAQQKVPTLMYHEHNYKGKSGSTVTLNGKKISEGGKAADGVIVENILVDGVILKYGNDRFKMGAFSSWVNM